MAKWIARVVARIRMLVKARRSRLSVKAVFEVDQLRMSMESDDVFDVLANLTEDDFVQRIESDNGGWLYVFKPEVGGRIVYLKVALRDECIVVSFHEDKGEEE